MTDWEQLKKDAAGLVPAIVQDDATGEVLMVAWMNQEAWEATRRTRQTHFWSRSRGELWAKGATSGNTQEVVSAAVDCDADTVLVRVKPAGPACHTGARSCFFDKVPLEGEATAGLGQGIGVLTALETLIRARKSVPEAGSYTNWLFEMGVDKILKKVGEEAAEVIIAAKNREPAPLVAESADLLYHLLVLLVNEGVPLDAVMAELAQRHGQPRRHA